MIMSTFILIYIKSKANNRPHICPVPTKNNTINYKDHFHSMGSLAETIAHKLTNKVTSSKLVVLSDW